MKSVFITGTDTGVGKTVVTGLLARHLMDVGCNVVTQKWVETGTKGFSRDVDAHLKMMRKKKKDFKRYLPYVSPYTFKFLSSPHLASRLGKEKVRLDKIKFAYRLLKEEHDTVVVEGVGGALVPLSENKLCLDLAKELKLPIIIVVGNKLGAINHTLLTIEAAKERKMNIVGLIFNNLFKGADKTVLEDNVKIIKKMTGEKVLGVLPYSRFNSPKAAKGVDWKEIERELG